MTDDTLPRAIGKVATRELAHHGITTLAEAAECTERDLLAIHGIGPKVIRILREELAAIGRSFVP